MKKYMEIERLKPEFADGFEVGDNIVIQEKIDGANFSIKYDSETDTIKAFSRKKELDCENDLRGAWEWSQSISKDLVKTVLGDNLILFAEWLVKHTVEYPNDKYNNAYCYDIYDTETQTYLTQEIVEEKVKELGLMYVPVFYVGNFVSWEHVKSFVGKTDMGGEAGEGVVVKNQTKLNNPNKKLPFYTKIVTKAFSETKPHRAYKPVDPNKLAEKERQQELVATVVTEARVRKLINKLVDDGIIHEDWDAHDMGLISKHLSKGIYEDCVKEENDTVMLVGEMFGKYAGGLAMKIARDILNERSLG